MRIGHRLTALTLATLALAPAGCGEDGTPSQPGVSTGRGPVDDPGALDGGADGERDGGRPSPRPPDGPRLPPADEVIELPYGGDTRIYRIEVEADLAALDVHLSIDTSASIGAEIDALQADLEDAVIPQLRERVNDVSFGVSRFEDFPGAPFGAAATVAQDRADTPFTLLTPVTSDVERIASAVAQLDQPLGFGGDAPESGYEALWQVATGQGYRVGRRELVPPFQGPAAPGGGVLGGVGFRERSLHVVLHVTDAPSHEPEDYGDAFTDTHGADETAEALTDVDARLVGIVTGRCPEDEPADFEAPCTEADLADSNYSRARTQLEALAVATSSVAEAEDGSCPLGVGGTPIDDDGDGWCPLVFDAADDGTGLSGTLVDAIVTLVDGIRFERVVGSAPQDPLGFVQRLAPAEVEQADGVAAPVVVDRLPEDTPDGLPDAFEQVRARARLGFDVHLRNTNIAPARSEQRFRVVVAVLGDELTLAERTLRIAVPPAASWQPDDDAGVAVGD
ncbi:MAG: hypothetical protein PVI30_24735 [Myxococcales bacterium]